METEIIQKRDIELVKIMDLTSFMLGKYKPGIIEDLKHDKNNPNALKIIDLDDSAKFSEAIALIYAFGREMSAKRKMGRCRMTINQIKLLGKRSVTINALTYNVTTLWTEYSQTKDFVNFKYKTSRPLIRLLTCYKMAYDEIKVSCSKFKVCEGNVMKNKHINNFALTNAHIPFLRGITYKPERRLGQIETLGPLTLGILLVYDKINALNISEAFLESLHMLPMAMQIYGCIEMSKSTTEVVPLLRALGDILLIIGNRLYGQINFPLLFIYKNYLITNDFKRLHFRGMSGLTYYNIHIMNTHFRKKSKAVSDDISQICFHSMFGTSVEDLGVLSQITSVQNWKKRNEISDVFIKADTGVQLTFNPINFNYASKLTAAIKTKKPDKQVCCSMVFSGYRTRCFSDEFLEYLKPSRFYPYEIGHIICALIEFKMELNAEKNKMENKNAEPTLWHAWDINKFVPDESKVVEATGQYFYS